MARYIDAEIPISHIDDDITICKGEEFVNPSASANKMGLQMAKNYIHATPTADVVEAEKYNDLREAFVDFVCSGVHNPAPYCKNRCDECVDSRGWCTYRRCNGFNPDGRSKNND